MLKVANVILQQGYCTLSEAFKLVSPMVRYTAEHARRRLLQMPLICIRIGEPQKGQSFSILMEKFPGTDYSKLGGIINGLVLTQCSAGNSGTLQKSVVKMLLSIAQSDRERKSLQYAICSASGITPTEARRRYGFQHMKRNAKEVEDALDEIQCIREAIADLASVEDTALLQSFGIDVETSSTSSESESDPEEDKELSQLEHVTVREIFESVDDLQGLLKKCNYNWFEFLVALEKLLHKDVSPISKALFDAIATHCNPDDMELVCQSFAAYSVTEDHQYEQNRIARVINGEIVSESESDDPEAYVGVSQPLDESGKALIAKKRRAIQRRGKRKQEKAIAEKHFLSRKGSKRVSKILKDCPDIGETIEAYVREHQVGADAWRRTGVLTFDGNTKIKEKVTYEKIRQHLQNEYHRNFSYGTVIQLCVPRNKRRQSSKRYKSVAKVTSRRARKGFNLKFNPDEHWSGAFYKGLNKLQYTDGADMVNINRDDATGFRLDTLTTCKQYSTPAIQGSEVLSTRTDYVNKYPSVLQTTSYNFSRTATTGELCAGVVKAPKVHEKNPAQHMADLCKLENQSELIPAFVNMQTGMPKSVECIRVDGASDEGPSHEEVQYWWTERHILKERVATLVTTRSSGCSYLNRVELQNGCLSLGHAHTFIPSTLGGSCYNQQTGEIDDEKLRRNMDLAIEAYISRVNQCSCGDTCIHLYRGADAGDHREVRDSLLTFLKGSKTAKDTLHREKPQLYARFQSVWNVRQKHMVKGLPSQYIFMLTCCFDEECPHPVCQKGMPSEMPGWYKNGPAITHLPLPMVDVDRPWGNTSCSTCKGFCAGHYRVEMVDTTDQSAMKSLAPPPSLILKSDFSKLSTYPPSETFVKEEAEKVLLTPDDTRIWMDHLNTVLLNRKRGAAKAAATRRAKKSVQEPVCVTSQATTYCGGCGKPYVEETEEVEIWICCDLCNQWCCGECENLQSPPTTDYYFCKKCC